MRRLFCAVILCAVFTAAPGCAGSENPSSAPAAFINHNADAIVSLDGKAYFLTSGRDVCVYDGDEVKILSESAGVTAHFMQEYEGWVYFYNSGDDSLMRIGEDDSLETVCALTEPTTPRYVYVGGGYAYAFLYTVRKYSLEGGEASEYKQPGGSAVSMIDRNTAYFVNYNERRILSCDLESGEFTDVMEDYGGTPFAVLDGKIFYADNGGISYMDIDGSAEGRIDIDAGALPDDLYIVGVSDNQLYLYSNKLHTVYRCVEGGVEEVFTYSAAFSGCAVSGDYIFFRSHEGEDFDTDVSVHISYTEDPVNTVYSYLYNMETGQTTLLLIEDHPAKI